MKSTPEKTSKVTDCGSSVFYLDKLRKIKCTKVTYEDYRERMLPEAT
ncbi:hypothetical protein ACQUW5_13065 [Legionella sp. CNM-1927-20]